jgi:Uncharacterized protein with a C-terminal OMP (outer membrane protein) domain
MKKRINLQRALLLSTALSAGFSATAHAGDVTVSTAQTAADVQTAINTAIAVPDSDLNLTVAATGSITGGSIGLTPSAGQGDGAISFVNNGALGAVDTAGAVTDTAGATFYGVGNAAAANTFSATNGGLVSGGLNAFGFGGNVGITNSGTVYNGVVASSYGDVSVASTAAGLVRSGNVSADSITTATSATVGGITTTDYASGTATVDQQGDVANQTDTARGDVTAEALNGASVTVGGKADEAAAYAGGTVQTVSGTSSATAGTVVTTTSRSDNILGGGAASVAITQTGDVNSAYASSVGGASVSVDGSVDGSAQAYADGYSSTNTSVSVDDGATPVSDSYHYTQTAAGKTASVTVGQSGEVAGDAIASGNGGATGTINGAVDGDVELTSQATNYDYQSNSDYAAGTSGYSYDYSAAGGAATGSVGATGSIGGDLIASADGGVTLSNAGTIEGDVIANSNRSLPTNYSETYSSSSSSSPTLVESSNQEIDEYHYKQAGGAASFANAATGQVQGDVSINALGDVTVDNKGAVFGSTDARSTGSDSDYKYTYNNSSSTAIATPPTLNVTTSTNETVYDYAETATGGNVTGTYSGSNGTLNFVSGDGSITQEADKASKATVTGTVYGSLNSYAGSSNSTELDQDKTVTVLDTAGDGTRTITSSDDETTTTNAGGDSTVTVSGKLVEGSVGGTPSLYSSATGNSAVTISGSVAGDVESNASATDYHYQSSYASSETVTGGVYRTDSIVQSSSNEQMAVGGSASVDLTGSGKAAINGGDVEAYGRTGASVTVAKDASVGGTNNFASVYASASGTDYLSTSESTFTRDPAAQTGTTTSTSGYSYTVSDGVGDATVAIAGTVSGDAEASSSRGNATTTVTGTVGDDARAYASGNNYATSTTTDYAGEIADSSTSPAIVKQVYTESSTQVGGTASVVVNTDAALKNLGALGVADDVDAEGVTAASVTIAAGSKVGGDLSAESNYTNYSYTQTRLYNDSGVQTDETIVGSSTLAGGDASISVGAKSEVGGEAYASGNKSASVSNAGAIEGSVYALSLNSVGSGSLTSTNLDNAALRQDVSVQTLTGVGGTASVTNASGATIGGDVTIAAGTGTVTNSGGIAGSIYAGDEVANYTTTQTDTVTDTVQTVTPAAALTAQNYTINQNNFLGGGVYVSGATVSDPFGRADEPDVKTSNVSATVNLNNGSVTLGSIVAQQDEDGNRLTNTTLNLNGSGYLGADKLNLKTPTSAVYSPEAVLSKEAQDLGFGTGSTGSVRILGVEAVNKADAGTFVLDLAPYIAPDAPGLQPGWSADVGAINVKAGEIQLTGPAYDPTDADGDFIGIKGNINVDGGTLVVGRRTLIGADKIGNSLTNEGTETITGVKVALTGDYTQTATGTTVVGVSPSLVRAGAVSVGTSNGGAEVLGPIQAGANVPYFTTAANGSSVQSSPSRIDVTGKLNLAGKLVVDVTRDAIYSNGDGYTLFSYTDAASAVSATVSQSISSPFVSFELKNDTAAKTVSIAAKRTSYASAATNPNAVSAAGALDALIPVITTKIAQDANGGAVFTSVNEMGLVQDAANIISGLDWRLTLTGAQQVFNELSSAEIYGSLAAIEQNSALTESFESAAVVGATGKSGFGFWINPVGRFARYGGTSSGASKIRDNSYGGAFGFNLGYSDEGTLGIGFAYAEHDIAARGTPESAKARTYSLGLDWKQSFGPLHAGAQFVYGFSDFDVTRELTLLDRTMNASFKGHEWNANAELGYDVTEGSNASVMPYAKLALRHWSLGGFTEEGGAGIGVSSGRDSKTVFVPEVGVRLATTLAATEAMAIRPFGKLSYTFQGDIGSSRAFTYAAGGTPFILKGVDPKGYGSLDAGINALFHDRIGLFVQGGVNFGGSQKGAEARGGINVRF